MHFVFYFYNVYMKENDHHSVLFYYFNDLLFLLYIYIMFDVITANKLGLTPKAERKKCVVLVLIPKADKENEASNITFSKLIIIFISIKYNIEY